MDLTKVGGDLCGRRMLSLKPTPSIQTLQCQEQSLGAGVGETEVVGAVGEALWPLL